MPSMLKNKNENHLKKNVQVIKESMLGEMISIRRMIRSNQYQVPNYKMI